MLWSNNITQLLNITYPIIQAPMLGVATPSMVAAANSAHCLGALPLGNLSAIDCIDRIRATKQLTTNHFAVNIFTNEIPELTDELRSRYKQTKAFVEKVAAEASLELTLAEIDEIEINDYREQIDAIISEECKILSFTFGIPDDESIQKLKSHGTILIGTCTSLKEAVILEESGIDIICLQGIEAGGHQGYFKESDANKLNGLSLLSLVRDKIKTPIIYAGGITDGKKLIEISNLGAEGFQVGSLLLCSSESALEDFQKNKLQCIAEGETVLTKSFSGRYARGVRNSFIETLDSNPQYILPYPYQNKLTGELRQQAKMNSNFNMVSTWVGESTRSFSRWSTKDILTGLIAEANNNT